MSRGKVEGRWREKDNGNGKGSRGRVCEDYNGLSDRRR